MNWSKLKAPVATLFGVGALGVYSVGFGQLTGKSPCFITNATGMPCPGCGLTRSVLAFFRGDLPLALHYNAWGLLTLVVFGLLWLRWTWRRAKGQDAPFVEHPVLWASLLAGTAMVWLIIRLIPAFQPALYAG